MKIFILVSYQYNRQISFCITPTAQTHYEAELVASVSRIDGKGKVKATVRIEFDGRWPTMSVTDARSLDMQYSTYWLWSQFSLKKLNYCLSKQLTVLEQQWNDPRAIKSVNIEDTLSAFDSVDLNFGIKCKTESLSVECFILIHT